MTTRNLNYLFKPRSIALIGAGKRPSSVGAVLAHNLFNAGFDGPVMPVNPKHRAIEGVLAYPDVASLPVTPDLAVIATPAATVPGIVEQLAARGTRAAVIISAGFGEGANLEGKGLSQAFLDAARPKMLRILGPNCLGVLVPGVGLNASFAQLHPRPGKLAFVAQSGAMVTAVLDWASARGIGFSHLVIDIPEILELDINPLLADEYGVMALDARVKVAPAHGPAEARLAILPYPKGLEERIALEDGRMLLLRPIVPEDEPALQAAFARLSPEEIRLRFFAPMKSLPHFQAARFTQIDYDREMALVLTESGRPGRTEIYGVVRLYADPDNERAEYAIIVGRELSGLGLGRRMMERLIEYARGRGIGEIFGDVLQENTPMLRLCRELGFSKSRCLEEPGIVRVTLPLGESGHPQPA